MSGVRPLLKEAKTRYLQSVAGNPIPVELERPIISITFDDVPRSAMTNGVPLLDNFDVKATFYVASGLSKTGSIDRVENNYDQGCFLTPEDILSLHDSGHHIACHTYSHYMLSKGTAKELSQDARKNVRELCKTLNTSSIDHFSYPFGQVNFEAKKLLSKYYKTMRSSRPGINNKTTDLNLLRANGFYDSTFDEVSVRRLIEKAERSGGWLIFYTHRVTHDPDAYSCTPAQFEWLIMQCKSSKAQILPVCAAYRTILSRTSLQQE